MLRTNKLVKKETSFQRSVVKKTLRTPTLAATCKAFLIYQCLAIIVLLFLRNYVRIILFSLGVTFTLMHTPGETGDHIAMWIPKWPVIMPGDNIYECFPNLYTIRGSPPRDFEQWYRSLDQIRHLRANYLIPSHGTPETGEENIFDIITHYRDAIQFVNDQTVRWLNNGLEIDEVVEKIHLPPSLKSHRFLSECYGQVSWSVRGKHSGLLGWFDGDPVYLNPLSKQKKAVRLVELLDTNFGSATTGIERLLLKAKESLEKSMHHFNSTGDVLWDELQWGMELSSNALKASTDGTFLHSKAKNMMITCLKLLATSTVNNNARNYYLSYAFELQTGHKKSKIFKPKTGRVRMDFLQYRFKAEDCDDKKHGTVIFHFEDGEVHSYTLRHCILEYNNNSNNISWIPKDYDIQLNMYSSQMKDLLEGNAFFQESDEHDGIEVEDDSKWSVDQLFQDFLALIE